MYLPLPTPCAALAADRVDAGVGTIIVGAALRLAAGRFARIHRPGFSLTRRLAGATGVATATATRTGSAGAADAAAEGRDQNGQKKELLHEKSPLSCYEHLLVVAGYDYILSHSNVFVNILGKMSNV